VPKPAGLIGRIPGSGDREADEDDELIDLNRASFDQLRELGFSVTQATRLLTHRERQGGFDSFDDLAAVPGMPEDLLDEVRPKLRVG